MPSSSVYRANTTRAPRAPEPDADPRRRLPDLWACLRDPAGRVHYVNRREVDMIRVLTGDVYRWREVRG